MGGDPADHASALRSFRRRRSGARSEGKLTPTRKGTNPSARAACSVPTITRLDRTPTSLLLCRAPRTPLGDGRSHYDHGRMPRLPARLAVTAIVLAVMPLHRGSAQAAGSTQPAVQTGPRSRVLAINPLGIPFEVVSVEFEAALQGAFTMAGNFSYFSPDDYTRTSFELKGRLYPNEEAPRAFSVGLGVGAVNTREHVDLVGGRVLRDKTHPSIGVYVDYNWLLGRSDRFFVGTGLGAKRILGDSDEFDAPFVYGTARFLIGVAF